MERWIDKVAIVTGASSGIGYSLAKKLSEAGVKVVAVARRKERLEKLKNELREKRGKVYPFVADLKQEVDILNLFKWVKENIGPVHILINNAGVTFQTNLTDGVTQFWKDTFDVNVIALCVATREAVKNMRANKVDGHIIHINSVFGQSHINMPNMNVYAASKHAVTSLSDTLRDEFVLYGDKIKITSVSPGCVNSEMGSASLEASGLTEFSEEVIKAFGNIPRLEPEDVANVVMFALSTPPHVQIPELSIKALGEKF